MSQAFLLDEAGSDFSGESINDPDYIPHGQKRKGDRLKCEMPCKKSSNALFKENFFTIVERLNVNNKFITNAKCTTCGRVIRASGDVSSNFITHLKTKHSDDYQRYKNLKQGSAIYSTSQERFNYKLLKAIVDCALPVAVVEKKSFIDLFEDTGFNVMSRQTAMKKLEDMYSKMLNKIKVNITQQKYFCATTDIWSGNHRSFLGYTCHWLNDSFERKSVALACKRIRGVHSGEKIAQMIKEINHSFGLNRNNIVMTVTDNGSNFIKAFKEYGMDETFDMIADESEVEIPEFENIPELGKHHRCSSHTLNLLATKDYIKILKGDDMLYNRHTTVFEKCNNLWKKCKWPKSSEIVMETLGSALVVPVITRWNSLFDSVVKLLKFKEMLNKLNDRLSLPRFSLEDIEYLESFQCLMRPISEALDFLQGENNIFYGYLLPVIMTLSNKLTKISKISTNTLSSVAAKLEMQLRKRFDDFFSLTSEANIAIAAAVLTPDVKLNWLRVLQRDNQELNEESILRRVLETINFYMKMGKITLPSSYTTTECTTPRSVYFNFDDIEDNDSGIEQASPSKDAFKNVLQNQLYSYLGDSSTGVEIWKTRNILKEAAKLFNTPLTSSAPVERLFSFAGIINAPRRQSLTDISFETLTLMKANAIFLTI